MATEKETISIGLIGMGEMGKMYAERIALGGWKTINVADLPDKYDQLRAEYGDRFHVMKDGHAVSRVSDFIVYSVEAEYIDKVVAEYGPSTKVGSIVAGQTSVKNPERLAFEKYLPADVNIISVHSLHGPTVPTDGQALILIQHRGTTEQLQLVERILAPLNSRYVHMSYEEHDEITANTQAVTHAAFLSMGTAWRCMESFPWETGRYIGGIEIVKINITLRIYAAKWHVYAGLAILNPSARKQIETYSRSVSDLFKLMIEEREDELRTRVYAARDFIFGKPEDEVAKEGATKPLLLSDRVLDRFTIGSPSITSPPPPNSHLSLLAMVDCWHTLGIRPFLHLQLAATPVFRLWIGVAEYLFRSPALLDEAITAAVWDKGHRSDDVEFLLAARGWSQCVSDGDFEGYRRRFEETMKFFEPRFEESRKQGNALFAFIAEEQRTRGKEEAQAAKSEC